MLRKLKKEVKIAALLMRDMPAMVFTLFVLSVVCMNLFANKSLDISWNIFALDCGTIISWIPFLLIDIINKHYGPKASVTVTVVSIAINFIVCLLFFLVSKIPGVWGDVNNLANAAVVSRSMDGILGGNWFVIVGSSIAFLTSAVVDSLVGNIINKKASMKNDTSFKSFAFRAYVATMIGQFTDNFVFSVIVPRIIFGWSIVQCLTCAVFGMIVEVLFEVIFSPVAYGICKRWTNENVGEKYLRAINSTECQL